MLLRRLAGTLLLLSGSLVAVAGAAAVFTALDRSRKSGSRFSHRLPATPSPRPQRTDFFSIRRTHSELGYTFWILEGHGSFRCFELFDTWKEAVAEAAFRAQHTAVV